VCFENVWDTDVNYMHSHDRSHPDCKTALPVVDDFFRVYPLCREHVIIVV